MCDNRRVSSVVVELESMSDIAAIPRTCNKPGSRADPRKIRGGTENSQTVATTRNLRGHRV
eukprot:1070571-Rhodomonas_salina.1